MQSDTKQLTGKVCVISGVTSGIGRAAAARLAGDGAELIMLCRDPDRGEQTRRQIAQETGNEHLRVLQADFLSHTGLRRVADQIADLANRIDCLVNNAGSVFSEATLTADGVEATFAVNVTSHFLLTERLLPLLQNAANETGQARVVNVSSRGHLNGVIDFASIERLPKRYFALTAYRQSKLAMTLWTFELARRLAGTGVLSNCLCPGFVGTRIGLKHSRGLTAAAWGLARLIMPGPERAAGWICSMCRPAEWQDVTGEYFSGGRPGKPNHLALDEELAAEVWEVCQRLTGARYEGLLAPSHGSPE